jgi:hypothetical protein
VFPVARKMGERNKNEKEKLKEMKLEIKKIKNKYNNEMTAKMPMLFLLL